MAAGVSPARNAASNSMRSSKFKWALAAVYPLRARRSGGKLRNARRAARPVLRSCLRPENRLAWEDTKKGGEIRSSCSVHLFH